MTDRLKHVCWEGLPLRLAIGIMFAAHGAGKLFGTFDGPGISGFAEGLTKMGFAPGLFWAALVGGSEFFGGVALILGAWTRWAVWPLVATMLVAIFKVHGPSGFFLKNGGFEYCFVILGGLLTLFAIGSGPVSIDAWRGGCCKSSGSCCPSEKK